MKKRIYNAAPLPFQGQKRMWVKEVRSILAKYPSNGIYVDLFGGSGLLSHTVKQEHPHARVIFNDYDDYHVRLANIAQTNALLEELRQMVQNVVKKERLTNKKREEILQLVQKHEHDGFVDYITLSSSLLFSGKYANDFNELTKNSFYNRVRKENYSAECYLAGVEIVKYDYRALHELYKGQKDVVFIVDPPYLSTDCSSYKNSWKIKDYLDVLLVLDCPRYLFFTSDKSQLIELVDWMTKHPMTTSPFCGKEQMEITSSVNFNSKYKDIMIYSAA